MSEFWPARLSRRLEADMADDRAEQRRPEPWSQERIATLLVPRREQLIAQLPRELAAARGLSRDQHELIVDESIDYMVTEYAKPVRDDEHLDRAFWLTASLRVRRAREGRGATVRAGWLRVSIDDIHLAANEPNPEAAVVGRDERRVLLEFAATLTLVERQVLGAKYGSGTEQGRVVVARHLGIPIPTVRRAERAITRKLERFAAMMAAGSLCALTEPAITALAGMSADAEQEAAARLHLKHCPTCRMSYKQHIRALRAGETQRRLGELLPVPPGAELTGRRTGLLDVLPDWLARPFGPDTALTAAQVGTAGRGIGSVAAVKLAALCVGGAATICGGVYSVSTTILDEPRRAPRQQAASAAAGPQVDSVTPGPEILTAGRLAALKQSPTRRRPNERRTAGISGSTGPADTRHERETPISPVPPGTPATATSEFDPQPAGPPAAPATAPETGAPEFP